MASLFFFQAEDGIRDLVRSRGLGDVYKRQVGHFVKRGCSVRGTQKRFHNSIRFAAQVSRDPLGLSLIHN